MPDEEKPSQETKEMDLVGILTKNPKMVLVVLAAFLLSGGNIAQLIKPGDDSQVLEKVKAIESKLETVSDTVEIIKIEQALAKKTVGGIETDIRENREDIKTLIRTPSGRPP